MPYLRSLGVSVLLLSCLVAAAKDKKKHLLPVEVVRAQTVLVVVDPNAGVTAQDPNANRTALEDVEKALMRWGRFSLAMEAADADLIVTVRKGNRKIAQPGIGGVPDNNRPVVLEPDGSGGRIGVRNGNPRTTGDPTGTGPPSSGPYPQVEVGASQDTFVVYRGNKDGNVAPLDAPAVWRYTAKDALQSPSVPAVEAFRKVIEESEKLLNAPTP